MYNVDKNKIINIILISVSVIVFLVCLLIVLSSKGTLGEDVVILKDMLSDENREVDNKTNTYDGDMGSITIKGEQPENFIDPTDFYTERDKNKDTYEEPLPNSETRESIFVGNPDAGPLEEPEDEIISVEVIEPFIPDLRMTIEEVLAKLGEMRNKGLKYVSLGFSLHDSHFQSIYLSSIKGENGLIIVPFNLSNEKQMKNLENWSAIYDTYSSNIPIIFLNTSYYAADSYIEILTDFNNRNINSEIPVYFDMENFFSYELSDSSINEDGYFILNRDGFIYKSGGLDTTSLDLAAELDNLNKTMEEFKVQEDYVITKYKQGYIRNYDDIQRAIDGTLEAYIIENNIQGLPDDSELAEEIQRAEAEETEQSDGENTELDDNSVETDEPVLDSDLDNSVSGNS